MVMSCYQETRPECRIESFNTSGNRKQIDYLIVDGHSDHCKKCLKLWVVFTNSVSAGDSSLCEGWGFWARKQKETDGWRGTKSERCGILSGGKTSNRSKKLRIISDPTLTKNDLPLLNLHWKKQRRDPFMAIFIVNLLFQTSWKQKFRYEWLDSADKLENKELPQNVIFFH